jgi:hypothetical protein
MFRGAIGLYGCDGVAIVENVEPVPGEIAAAMLVEIEGG